MSDQEFNDIIELLENKKTDCVSFAKKYKTRGMDDLYQYYEGAKWALEYAISSINKKK